MSEWSIYWIIKLDAIITFLSGLSAFAVAIGIILVFGLVVNIVWVVDEDMQDNIKDLGKRIIKKNILLVVFIWFSIVCLHLTTSLLPTTKEYLVIKGVSYATNNERINTTADKIFDGVEDYIDKKLAELDGEITIPELIQKEMGK